MDLRHFQIGIQISNWDFSLSMEFDIQLKRQILESLLLLLFACIATFINLRFNDEDERQGMNVKMNNKEKQNNQNFSPLK